MEQSQKLTLDQAFKILADATATIVADRKTHNAIALALNVTKEAFELVAKSHAQKEPVKTADA